MPLVWFVAGGCVAVGLAVLWLWRRAGTPRERRERPVLPSHYSSLLQADRSRYPGLCPACGTENTPGYRFCKECGERLPGGARPRAETDVSKIFRE